ncbi:MAG: ribonuclease HII [Pseudomonadota bacterium]
MAAAAGLPAPVAGVDEVGRGPLAGPLVAAAVILPAGWVPAGLDDSKRVPEARRRTLAAAIRAEAAVGLAVIEVEEIDTMGLGPANDAALCRALAALPRSPAAALVDGRRLPRGLAVPGRAVVGGDGSVAAIAAASIVAKVARDAMMAALDLCHPGYGWAENRGYGTARHLEALATLGPTAQHRRSFAPVKEALKWFC